MNIQNTPLWTNTSSEGRLTGTWRTAMPDYRTAPSPCLGACPVNGRIAEWIGHIRDGDAYAAWLTLVDNNPFPAIAGRICHHPCETACNRQFLDETVSICALERHVGDLALAEGWRFPDPAPDCSRSVAIVGGGPAGLSAAYQLRRRGIRVTLFEAADALGGLLRHGIPDYRLDKTVLDGEIARILDLGVEVRLNAEIFDAAALHALRESHDAVYLATGATASKRLPNLDYGKPWVVDSADFLAAANAGAPRTPGARIVVIGGGSAAMDVARTARRLGKAVTVLSLEPETLLPAQRIEVDEALEEGIEFVTGAMMRSVEETDRGLALDCVRVDFHPGAKRGDFTVQPVADGGFALEADAIVPSIGQNVDLARWAGLLASDGPVLRTDGQWRTDADGVFAGGDVASMDRFVTQAVGMGKQATAQIAHALGQAPAPAGDAEPQVPYTAINTHYYPAVARHRPASVTVAERLRDFREVQHALAANEALAEANRCFSCGTCIYCDNCYLYCPDMAITRLERGYEVKADYCKGCGLCVEECPTSAITMRDEARETA